MDKHLLLGISSCLLGEKVRFDGGHKRDNFICDFLANYVDFLPICPEVAIGLGVPRPALHLRGNCEHPRLVEAKDSSRDYTSNMVEFSIQCMKGLNEICGYILKSKSPSCGLKNVKVYQDEGQRPLAGLGLYARVLKQTFPNLPIEEEGRLNDPRLRENFVERIFIYNEWKNLVKTGLDASKLVEFHTRHKLTLLAHSPSIYKVLGKMLSNIKLHNLEQLNEAYISIFMRGMSCLATPKKHANVLQHCLGYFKKQLDSLDKQELVQSIDNYRSGLLPLIVPVTLFKHHLNRYQQPYLSIQSYLDPYPQELMLRNHI
ncbi:hypothetical protein BN59_02761 [Legionella massiliensis]|uniref:DUF1722 domain-containing protein n=1 Tax=Legionella massiliensis TaxID=1034943 RepID=A0A078L009_9GAMM|nr:DUF523 and DUF1722 domain-containing protein [Legionella massiliensis]CDZ78451.1 hypothetical protein BN59_02761 [Legionella massiliensis]CEE14189.1 hypothetical protein BN1094_02761 [Legionella massiliensis]